MGKRLLSLYEAGHRGNTPLTVEFHELQYQQLVSIAKRNGVTPEQMIEEIVNSFLTADTGSASHD